MQSHNACPCNATKSFDSVLKEQAEAEAAEQGFAIRCEDAQSRLQGLFEEDEVLYAVAIGICLFAKLSTSSQVHFAFYK